MPKRHQPGVFCLEGEWESRLTDRSTVRPILDLLDGRQIIRVIHKDVATPDELGHYLNKWLQKQYASFDIGYLAFHGSPGVLFLGRKKLELEHLADLIAGRGNGRVLYFGSCSTLDIPKKRIDEFLQSTKLKAVCGYRADVEWLESAAFELLLIEALSHYRRIDFADRWLRSNYGQLCRSLKYKMHW